MTTPVAYVHMEDARLTENMAMGGFDLHALSYKGAGGAGVFRPIENPVIQSVKHGEMLPPEPMLTLSHRSAQILFDALYRAGLRPSSGEVSSGHTAEVAAIRAHLEDMRVLAFRGFESQGNDMPLNMERMVI